MKKKNINTALTLALISSVCAMTIVSSAYANEEVVTVKFWDFHMDKEKDYMMKIVDEYNSSHTDVQIEYTSVNQSDYTTTLIPTAYANGEAPDVLLVEPATFLKYQQKGMLADLTEYYSDELKADMLETVLDSVSVDEKIYALPFEMETLGLFYNVDLFEENGLEAPTTWDEMLEDAKLLTDDSRYGLVLPVEGTAYSLFNFWPFIWMAGADVKDADGNFTVNSEEMATALDYWRQYFEEGLAPSSLQIGPWDIGNIGTGVAAMQVGGTYMINAAENDYPDMTIGAVPFPSPADNSVTVAGGQKFAVNASSEHVAEAAQFIFDVFGSDDLTYASGWVTEAKFAYPARKSVIDSNGDVFAEGLKLVFSEFYDSAVPEPGYEPEVTDALINMMQDAFFGGYTGAEACEKAQEVIETDF